MISRSPALGLFDKAAHSCKPLKVQWALTHRCNLACRHCNLPASPNSWEVSLPQAVRFLDQLATEGALFLTFSGGEPLMFPQWSAVARRARERGFALHFRTNGTLIDGAVADTISSLRPLSVQVSLHGATSASHDQITGRKGSFRRTLRGICLLTKRGVPVSIKSVITRRNWRELPRLRQLSKRLDASFSFSFNVTPGTDGSVRPLKERIGHFELRRILREVFPVGSGLGARSFDENIPEDDDNIVCQAGRDTCAIQPDGTVVPCPLLPIASGNLYQRSFSDIWRFSPVLVALRGLRNRHLHDCHSCSSRHHCLRCPGVALLEDGDVLGRSSWACAITRAGSTASGTLGSCEEAARRLRDSLNGEEGVLFDGRWTGGGQ